MRLPEFMKRRNIVRILFVSVGAVAGFAYYYFIGCANGTCPITGNPYASTLYGGVMGFALGMIREG